MSLTINWENLVVQTKGKEVEDFLSKASIADVIFTMNEAVLKETLFICMKKFEKFANVQLLCIQLLQDCQVLTPRGITNEELINRFDNLIKPLSLWIERTDIIIHLFELLAMVADRKSVKSKCTRIDSNDLLSYIGQALEMHRKEKLVQRAGLQLYEAILINASEKSQKVFAKMMFKAVVNNLATTNDDPKICYSSYSILCTLAEKMGDKLAPWVDRILGLLLTTISQLFSAELVAKCIQLLEKIALTQESLYVIVAHPRCLLVFTDALGILEAKHMGASITVLEYLLRVLEDESALAVVSQNLNERRVIETNYFVEFRKILHKKSKKYFKYLEESEDIEGAAVEYWKQLLEYIMNILSSLLELEDLVDEEEVVEIIELPIDKDIDTNTTNGNTIDVSYDSNKPLEPIPEEDHEHTDHNSDEEIQSSDNTNNQFRVVRNTVRFVDEKATISENIIDLTQIVTKSIQNEEKIVLRAVITWENIDEQIEGHEVEIFLNKADIADCLFTKNKVTIKKSLFLCLNKFRMFPMLQNRAIHLLQDCQVLTPEGITTNELMNGYEILLNSLSQWINNVAIVTDILELFAMVADRDIMKDKCILIEQNQLLSYIGQALEMHQKEKLVQRAGLQLYEAILINASEKSQKVFAKMMIKAVVNNLATTNDDPKICYSSYSILCTLAEKMGDKLAPWVDRILGLLLTTISQLFSAELVAKCIQLLEKIALTQESLFLIASHPRCLLVFTDALGILEVRYYPETIKVLEYLLKVLENETAVSVIFENLKDQNHDEVTFFINFRKEFFQKSDRYVNLLKETATSTTHNGIVLVPGKIDYTLQLIEVIGSILTHLLPDDILAEIAPEHNIVMKKDTGTDVQQANVVNTIEESEETPCDDITNCDIQTAQASDIIIPSTSEQENSDIIGKDIKVDPSIVVNQSNDKISSNAMMNNGVTIQSPILSSKADPVYLTSVENKTHVVESDKNGHIIPQSSHDTLTSLTNIVPIIALVPMSLSSSGTRSEQPQQHQDIDEPVEEQKIRESDAECESVRLLAITYPYENDTVENEKIKNERNSNIKFLIETNPIQHMDRNVSMDNHNNSTITIEESSTTSSNCSSSDNHQNVVNEDDYMLIYARALDAKFEEDRLLAEQEAKLDNDRKVLLQKQTAAEALRLAAIQKAELEITMAKQLVEQERIAAKAQVDFEIAEAQEKAEHELQELKLQTELEVMMAKEKAEKELLETKIKAEKELELVKLKAEEEIVLMREKASLVAAEITYSMEQAEQNRIVAMRLAEKDLQDMKDKAEINRIKAEKQAEAELSAAEAKAEAELALLLKETEKIALLDSIIEKEQARKLLENKMIRVNEEEQAMIRTYRMEESSRRKYEQEETNRLLDEENSIHLSFQKEQEASRLLFESQQEALRIDLEEQKEVARIAAYHESQRIIFEAEVTAARIMKEQELKAMAITTEAEELALRISIEKDLRIKQEKESHETLSLLIAQQDAVRITLKETEERTQLLLEEEKAKRLAFEIERDKIRIIMEEEHLATQTMIAALKEAARIQQENMLVEQERFKAQQDMIRMEVEKANAEKEKIRIENERLLAEKKAIERQAALEKLAIINKERETMRQQRELERMQSRDKAMAEAEERKRVRIAAEQERMLTKEKLDIARKQAKEKAIELATQRQLAIEKVEKQALQDKLHKQQALQEADRITKEQSNQHIEAIKLQAKEKAASKIAAKEKDRMALVEESKRLADIAKAKINELLIEKETRLAALQEQKLGLESLFLSSQDHDVDDIKNDDNNTINTTNSSEHDLSFEVIEFETPIKSKPITIEKQPIIIKPINISNHWRVGNMKSISSNAVFNHFITPKEKNNMYVDLSQECGESQHTDEVQQLYMEALQEVQVLKNENDNLKQQLTTNPSPYSSGRGSNLPEILKELIHKNISPTQSSHIYNNNNIRNNNNISNYNNSNIADRNDISKSNKIDLVISGIMEAFMQVIYTSNNNNNLESKNEIRNKLENMLSNTTNNDNTEYIHIFANKLVLLFRKIKEEKETILCTNDNIISLRVMKLCLKLIGFIDNCHLQGTDIDIIISQLGVKQLSLYGFVFTLILCAGKFLGQTIFNINNTITTNSNNSNTNASSESIIYEDGLQGFPLFIEVIGIMVDNLLELLDTQHNDALLQHPLGKCKMLYESEEKEIIKLFEREKKALKQIYEIYCPNPINNHSNNNNHTSDANHNHYNTLDSNQTSTGLSFSCIVTLCHDFKLLPSMFNRNQLLAIYQLVLSNQYTIHKQQNTHEVHSKYIFPTILLHDNNDDTITSNTNNATTNTMMELSSKKESIHALDITNKLYLSFPRFLDFLIIASLKCPIFKSTDSCLLKVSNFLLLLHQSCQSNEKYLSSSSIKFRNKEIISFRVNPLLATSPIKKTPTSSKKYHSLINNNANNNKTTTTNNNNNNNNNFSNNTNNATTKPISPVVSKYNNIPVTGSLFSPPSYHYTRYSHHHNSDSHSDVVPYYDPTTGSIAHSRRRKSIIELKSKLSDMH